MRSADADVDLIRAAASCANEVVDALALPPPRQAAAIERVAQRYVKLLDIAPRGLHEALQQARAGGHAMLDTGWPSRATTPTPAAPAQ